MSEVSVKRSGQTLHAQEEWRESVDDSELSAKKFTFLFLRKEVYPYPPKETCDVKSFCFSFPCFLGICACLWEERISQERKSM